MSNSYAEKDKQPKDCQEKKQIKIAVTIDKHSKDSDFDQFTTGFVVTKTSYEALARYVKEGKAIGFDFKLSPEERKEKNRELRNNGKLKITDPDITYYREQGFFKGSEFIVIDFDRDLTLAEVKENKTARAKFINETACILYTSANHRIKRNGDRLHILFHLPHEITERERLKEIQNALHNKFPDCDKDNLVGAYPGCGENAEVFVFGNRLTEQDIEALFIKYQPISKPTFTYDPKITDLKKYAESIYDQELHKLSQATKNERNNTLNNVAFKIGQILLYLNLPEEQALDSIIRVAESIGTDKSFTSTDIKRTAKSGLRAGIKNLKELTDRDSTYYESTYGLDQEYTPETESSDLKRLFENKPKDGHHQVSKSILDMYPKVISEADQYIANSSMKTDIEFQTFAITTRDENPVSATQVLDVLNTLKNVEAMRCYCAIWKYASRNSRFEKVNNRIVLDSVDLNEIVDILNPGIDLSKQNRYKKREALKGYIKTLGTVIFFNESNSTQEDIGRNIRRMDLTGNFIIESNRLTCYLPWQLQQIGSYIPDSYFKLSGNEKTAQGLLLEIYRRTNQKYITSKQNGYKAPEFISLDIRRDVAINCAGLELTDKINSTEANKSLREGFSIIKKKIGTIDRVPKIPSTKDGIIHLRFRKPSR